MNPAQQITAWLKAHSSADHPVTRTELRLGTGLTGKQISDRLHRQIVRGMVGTDATCRIWFLRDRQWRPKELTADEKRARKRERDTAQRRRNGATPMAEFHAQRAQARSDRLAKLKAEREAARIARGVTKAELARQAKEDAARIKRLAAEVKAANEARAKLARQRQQEAAAQDRRDRSRADKARLSDSLAGMSPAAPVVVEYETVEQWLARGGQIHRLAPHEVSQPFQRIGFNNQVLGRD